MTKTLIIDTREPYEYEKSHVEGAINISPAEFLSGVIPEALENIPKDTPIIMYCMTGHRSNTCSMILYSYGFTDITNGTNENRVRQMLQKAKVQ
jgi:rhodanese-related sulfurtransferase